ncbi:Nardilysin-like [Geodia barretti]|nr:Nardilysin-like [Geodia barretti]
MRLVKEAPDFLGNPRRFAFNYSLVESVLDTLTPERLVLFLGTHHLNFSSSGLGPPDDNPPPEQNSSPINFPWPELDQKEPIYSTPFSSIDTPPELLEYWGSLTPVPQNLSLPGKNHFIPTDFGLLKPPSNLSDTPSRVSVASKGVSLWFLQDTTFETPHVNMYCSITAANPDSDSVRWIELTVLYAQMVVEVLTPVLYPAAELTYSMGLSATPQGLQLTFSGFSDPNIMTRYIGNTVLKMKDYDALVKVFDIVREKRRDFLENYKYSNLPYRYIYNYIQQVVMERPYWKLEEELAVVNDVNITADDVIQHAVKLFTDASFLCFAHGNINQELAREYTMLVSDTLTPSPSASLLPPSGGYQRQRVTLADPGSYSVTLPTLNPSDKNSAVNVVFQVGPPCSAPGSSAGSPCEEQYVSATAHLGLIDHIIGDQCFYQLRTVEQLGYVVFCFQTANSGITSFQAVVQSQEYNASYVLGEIDKFLEDFEVSTIANFTDETLAASKELYARTLRKKSQTLRDESDRLWGEILSGREQFDYNSQLLGALDSITPESLRKFYRHHMTDPAQYKKLVVGVYGADSPVDLSQDSSYCIDWETTDHSVLEYNANNSNCSQSLTL